MIYRPLVLALVILASSALKFNSNGRFKIVQFTDMHLGEAAAFDMLTRRVQMAVIQAEKPDLIVVSGDAVSGYAYPNNNTCM
jgi:predicted MPP superfamily phosphohydrolase